MLARPWTGARKNPKSPRSESARPTAARSTTMPPFRASHATRNASSSRRRRWTRSTPRHEARRRARGPDPGDRRARQGFRQLGSTPRATGSSGSVTPRARPRRRVGFHRGPRPRPWTPRRTRRTATASRRRVPGASLAVRWPHRVGHPGTPWSHRGGRRTRRRAGARRRAVRGRRIRDDGVVGKNSPCLLRSTLRAKRYASL